MWLFNVSLAFNVELTLICVLFCSGIFWILFVLSLYVKHDFGLNLWCKLFIAQFLLGPDVQTCLVGHPNRVFLQYNLFSSHICKTLFLCSCINFPLISWLDVYLAYTCPKFGVFKVFKTYAFAYLKSFWFTLFTRI